MSNQKKKLIKGTIWSVFGQTASLLIILATNIWLARLLSPKEFGQVGVIMFFIALATVFTESGLSGALVRKQDATKEDYSTVFVTNLIFSIFCFIIIYFSSGFIASYYEDDQIKDLLIVAGLILIINAFQITQNAKLVSDMKFKEKSIYRFIAVVISSIIGLYFAYNEFGVWALILIQLLTAGFNTILLWIFEGFFLKLYFSKNSFKELYSFGVNTTLASLLNSGFDNIYQLVLAKYFSVSETGYFYQAKKLQDIPGGVISLATQSVIFSSLSKLQDDKQAFTKVYNKITLYLLVLLGFVSTFIYFYAEVIILLLYGKEWIGAIYYMQLLTIASFFYMQENLNRVIFKVFNQTRKILYLEYVKKTIQALSIGIGIYYLSLQILIIGFVITNTLGYLINYYYSRKIIGSVGNYELLAIFKVCIISVLTVLIISYLSVKLKLQGNMLFLISPFSLLFYLVGLYVFKVINIKNELKTFLKLYKR